MTLFFDDLEQQLRTAAVQQTARRPWWRRPRNLGLLAVAALGLGTPAVARVSGIWDPNVPTPPPSPTMTAAASAVTTCRPRHAPEPRIPANAGLDPALVAQIAVLRRPRRAEDALPAGRGHGGPLVDAETARYVGSVAGRRYFVAGATLPDAMAGCGKQPATRRLALCFQEERGGGGCGIGAEDFRRQGTSGSSGSDSNSAVVGLVPDDVAAVTVRYGSSERSFTVKNNFYGFQIAVSPERAPDAVIWTLRNGERRKVR